jgi:hypothetical protein
MVSHGSLLNRQQPLPELEHCLFHLLLSQRRFDPLLLDAGQRLQHLLLGGGQFLALGLDELSLLGKALLCSADGLLVEGPLEVPLAGRNLVDPQFPGLPGHPFEGEVLPLDDCLVVFW